MLSILTLVSGCAMYTTSHLSPDEQVEFRMYRKVLNAPQSRTYLSQATAAQRTAYLESLGLIQRFSALEAQDRADVQAGVIRKGMSAEALRFLWGRPTRTDGYTGHYEHWYYYGPTSDLVSRGSRPQDGGTLVDVYLVNNQVEWWLETVPSDQDRDASDSTRF